MLFTSLSAVSNINKSDFAEDISDLIKQDFSDKKILLYARETNKYGQLFRDYGDIIAKKYLRGQKYDIIADMESPRNFVLETNKYSYADYTTEDWALFREILDIDVIIRNDRAFRHSIPYYEACEMIYSCTKFMIEFFKTHKYDVVLTNMPDFYVPDIIIKVAQFFKIPIMSFCENAFGLNYMMITKYGRPTYVREPDDEEIEDLYQLLKDKATPYVLNKYEVYIKAFKNYLKHKVKYLYHHILLNTILGRSDYIFKLTNAGTYPRSILSFFSHHSFFISQINDLRSLEYEKTIYIPLHYYPEATTDYWISHPNYTTYYSSLFETVKKYSEKGYNILVKEHTAMFLNRNSEFYQQLNEIANVYLVSPFISTYDMFKLADFVVIWTGTTGIEAIIHDKKVILAYSKPYYDFKGLPSVGEEEQAKIFSEIEKKTMIKNILRSLLPVI